MLARKAVNPGHVQLIPLELVAVVSEQCRELCGACDIGRGNNHSSPGHRYAQALEPARTLAASFRRHNALVKAPSVLSRGFFASVIDLQDNTWANERLSQGANTMEDVQVGLEHAMIEAYRLLKEDKVEQAELLVTEGLMAAESVLEAHDPGLAQIWDQAALLQFFLGRFREAERNCLKSLEAAKALDNENGQTSAVAMCNLRLSTIYMALDRRKEASRLLEQTQRAFMAIYGPNYELKHEVDFYVALSTLPQNLESSHLTSIENCLFEALKGMGETPTVGLHLLRAAFREHRALMDSAVSKSDWALAECILLQAIRLQEELCPGSDELALTTYQYGTLEYVRGHLTKAMQLCTDSLQLALTLYKKETHSQVALRRHRVGTIQLAEGSYSSAIATLTDSSRRLVWSAGEANPLTGESRCALALAKLGQLKETEQLADAYTRILLPKHFKELESEAQVGMSQMQKGFGNSHMLTQKLKSVYNEILQA